MTQQPSRIVQENVDALIERERAGRIEHGDDMDRTDFPVEAWLAELISESLDSANYGRKLQHMLPKLVAAAKRLEGMGFAWADGSWQATCTCPSGDGSLRWPCPVHTAGVHGAVAKVGSDHFRSIVDWLGPIPPPNTLLYAAPVSAAPADNLHAHLLHMLGAKDHEDAGRIIGELHAATMRTPAAQEAVYEISHVSPMNFGGFCAQIITPTKLERGTKLYAAPVTAAPGIDLRQPVAYLDLGAGGYVDVGSSLSDEQLAELPKGRHMLGIIGTYGVDGYVPADSPKGDPEHGRIDPSWSLHDRVEFALRDAGFDLDEAAFVAEAASVANGDLESPKGGSEARDAARYRWLREFAVNGSIGIPFHGWLNCDEPASEWDSAIDAAMQAGDAEVQP